MQEDNTLLGWALLTDLIGVVPIRNQVVCFSRCRFLAEDGKAFRAQGMQREIASDRDPLVTNVFWEELRVSLGTSLARSAVYQ